MLLDSFAKYDKSDSFVMVVGLSVCLSVRPSVSSSVHLSVHTKQLGPHWTDFGKI
jgi:hypothetical protein